jgi:hypothetical protein
LTVHDHPKLVLPKNISQNKFYNSLNPDLVVFCKNNQAKNKTLIATKPVACERYNRGFLYKIGYNTIGSLDLKIWNY